MGAPALHRAMAILRLFRRDRARMTAPEIIAALGMPRSTTHSLLGDLVDLGLLRRDAGGRFELDSGVLTLGYEYLASSGLTNLAAPVLEALRNETNWSTHLGVRQGRSIVYLSRFASRAAITRNVGVGTSLPAHSTVMGRVLLSDLEPMALRDLYADHVFEPGPDGIACLGDLEDLLREDHARGMIASGGFHEQGVAVAAAPIRDASLRIVAAINATGTVGSELAQVGAAVTRAAHAISRLMGAPETIPATPRSQADDIVHEEDAS